MTALSNYESNINKVNESPVDRVFMFFNASILLVITVAILLPLIFIVSASFSSSEAVIAGRVSLWPVDFSLQGYQTSFEHKKVWDGFGNSLFYTVFGTIFNVFMTIIAAYPLSRDDLVGRRVITIAFIFTMLFSGGLIPTYMVVRDLGLLNTRAAMILPTGIGIFNLLITITFFRTTIPPELIKAAPIDGANDFRTFGSIILPLARPIIAVLALFYAVSHWNSYFSALIYLKDQELFPLQIVLREILIENSIDASMLIDIEDLVAREGLRYLNKLYAAGLFGEESFTQPAGQVKQQVEGGDASTIGVVLAGAHPVFSNIGGNRWIRYVALPSLEGPTGMRQAPFNPWGVGSGQCVINAQTEHAEAAFKWCDGLYDRETTLRSVFGVPQWEAEAAGEDGQWRWAEEGEPALGPEFDSIWRRLSTFGTLQNVHWAQRGPSYRPNHLRLGEVRRDDAAGLEVVLYEQTKASYEPYACDIADVLPPLAFTTAQAAEVTELRLGVTDFVAQMTAEFVLGCQDLDAGWDNFVATIEALGIDRMVEIYQVAYDAQFGG